MHFSLLSILGLLTACLLPIITTAQNSSSNAEGTSPIFTNVAPVLTGDTDAIAAITQGLSLYGIALDTKNFTALSGAFTSDVVAVVAPGGPIVGLAAYEAFLASNQSPYKTQHISTTVFAYDIGNGAAQSISYQQAIYFGSGSLLGQIVTFYERFDDTWRKSEADGSYKIAKRSLNIFVGRPLSRSYLMRLPRSRDHYFPNDVPFAPTYRYEAKCYHCAGCQW